MQSEGILKLLIGLLLVVLVGVVWEAMRERVVVAGDTAPNFTVVTDSGRQVTRSEFGGRLLVLNFWATWCPPCVEELPSLNEFQKQMAGQGVVVVGISVDRNEKTYRQFLQRTKVAFLTARDPEARISADYGTFKYPETYIIDSKGEVLEKFIGPENWMDPNLINRVKSFLQTRS
jgi:peroxiredoxin